MTDAENIQRRIYLTAVGGIAGLAAWSLIEALEQDFLNERLFLFLTALAAGFFGGFLAMVGPLTARRAALSAAFVAVPVALLVLWASFRFDTIEGVLENGHAVIAMLFLFGLPMPFLIAHGAGKGWRHYPALFLESWGIVVRYASAWVFTGLFWLVVFLSDQLLQIVGVKVIENFLDFEPSPFLLTGLSFGIAIAVVDELSDYVSPNLVLRLLRLLLPLVLVIVAIFIAALPFRGLSGLFGSFSAAATMMTMTLGAATLVTTALDSTDAEAVRSPIMRNSAQALAVLMPVLAVLAAYSIVIRVGDYGWTPNRVAAAVISAVVLGYAVFYAASVVLRRNWMQRIRQVNVLQALVILGVSVLWMTPVLNPQRIAVASQTARFADGRLTVEELDVWAVVREWGRAGQSALPDLRAGAAEADRARLEGRIARALESDYRWEFENEDREVAEAPRREELAALIPLYPDGQRLTEAQLGGLQTYELDWLLASCKNTTPEGHPACAGVSADFLPLSAGNEIALFFLVDNQHLRLIVIDAKPAGARQLGWGNLTGPDISSLGVEVIDAIVSGAYSVAPASANSLRLKNIELFIRP